MQNFYQQIIRHFIQTLWIFDKIYVSKYWSLHFRTMRKIPKNSWNGEKIIHIDGKFKDILHEIRKEKSSFNSENIIMVVNFIIFLNSYFWFYCLFDKKNISTFMFDNHFTFPWWLFAICIEIIIKCTLKVKIISLNTATADLHKNIFNFFWYL